MPTASMHRMEVQISALSQRRDDGGAFFGFCLRGFSIHQMEAHLCDAFSALAGFPVVPSCAQCCGSRPSPWCGLCPCTLLWDWIHAALAV